MLRGAALTCLALLLSGTGTAWAQVAAGGLGTRVNGTALGRCSAGVCSVQGGSVAGPNLFHRFSQFDTRSGIQRVDLDSRGRSNVVVGVSHPAGSFFNAPLRLSGAANLFWLSPGGLWLGNGARFQGATSLLLSTAPSLRIGGGEFNAVGGLADRLGAGADAPSLDLEALATGTGPIVLAGGRLTVDRQLLLHSGAGPILTAPGERSVLQAGGSVQLSGGDLQLRGLDIQAGNGADDRLLLRSGALVGGAPGRLELADATLWGSQVRLEGAGGLALERVEARGGDVLLRTGGPLIASDLRAQAGADGGGGQLELAADAAGAGGSSLWLERADLRGRHVVLRANGPVDLRQVQAQAGRDGDPGDLWLTSRPGPGGTASPIALAAVRLTGSTAVLQAAGDLRAQELEAQAERLWLRAEGPAGAAATLALATTRLAGLPAGDRQPQPAQLLQAQASGDLLANDLVAQGRSIGLRSGNRLALAQGSQLLAGDHPQGEIQLDALAAAGAPARGRLELADTRLEAQTLVARADQALDLRQVSGVAGRPGNRGLIQLVTAPTMDRPASPDPGAGALGEVKLQGVHLEGQRLIVRSGSIQLGGSQLQAPKGKILLEAKAGDLELAGSQLNVGVASREDLRSEVDLRPVGNNDDSAFNTPSIGLYAARDLRLRDGSRIEASQNLTPVRQANPDLTRGDIRLTDTSGLVVIDAGQALSLHDSTIAADATDNLAGNILLRAQARDGQGDLSLRNVSISASGGVGSGDIRLNSAHGIRLDTSRLVANSSHSPEDPNHPGQTDWTATTIGRGAFQGGEITLTNSASDQPIVLTDSQLRAEQSDSDGPLSPFNLTGRGVGRGWTDLFDDSDSLSGNLLGGVINIFSGGGIQIAGPTSWLSTSSTPPAGGPSQDFGGMIRLVNTAANQTVQIGDGTRLESITGPRRQEHGSKPATGGWLGVWSSGAITVSGATIDTQTLEPGDDPAASLQQGALAFYSREPLTINNTALRYGPLPGAGEGLGDLVIRTPTNPQLSDTTISPACTPDCNGSWDEYEFEEFLTGDFGPSIWGPFRGVNEGLRPERSPTGLVIKDEAFTGSAYGQSAIPDAVRRWQDQAPDRTVFQPGLPPINLSDLAWSDSSRARDRSLADSLNATAAPQEPPPLAWSPAVGLALLSNRAPLGSHWEDNSQVLGSASGSLSLGPTPLSENAALDSFLSKDQSASRDVGAALGLPPRPLQTLAIGSLQQALRDSVPGSRRPSFAAGALQAYVPAILQISTTPLRGGTQTQINHILIPASGEIRGWQSQVPSAVLQARIRAFQRQLSQQQSLEPQPAGRQLEDLLLSPVWSELQRLGINALLLSLDRGLQGVPFAALPLADGLLVDRVAVTITPALALTDLKPPSTPPSRRRTLLAGARHFPAGLMPLEMAEQELRQLASLHADSLVLLDGAFQTSTLLARTRERPVEILHLATHADFASPRADGARIYTSDGELSLADLGRQLRNGQAQPLSLFVLNACRTAVGNEERELGIAGLALQAGASSALGNLWLVDDVVTAAFSVQFHRSLQQGISKDQALQRTQQLFRSGRIQVRAGAIVNDQGDVLISDLKPSDQARLIGLDHPYYWAGAVLTGRPW